jgi:hypothetical protein
MLSPDIPMKAELFNATSVAIAFAGMVLAGFWREIHAFKRQIEKWQARIDTVLFGPDGGNGLHGTTKDHEQRLRRLEAFHVREHHE